MTKYITLYFAFGCLYMVYNLVRNFILFEEYRRESLNFKITSMLMDIFIWPFGIVCDVVNKLEDK